MKLEYYSLNQSISIQKQIPRVVSLMPHLTDHLVSLNIQPIGTVTVNDFDDGFHDYLKPYLHNSTSIGRAINPNLKKIAALKPDLILGEGKKHLCLLDELNAIAPTILFKDLSVDWKLVLTFLGTVFDKQKMVEGKLHDFNQKLAELSKDISESNLNTKNILFANFWKPNVYRVYSPKSHLGKIIYDELKFNFDHLAIFKGTEKPLITVEINEIIKSSVEELFILTEDSKTKPIHFFTTVDEDNGKYYPTFHHLSGLKDGVEGKGLVLYNQILFQLMEIISINSKEVQKIV